MVFVKMLGGLGNQMFEYATARRIAEVNKTGLKLDLSGYKNDRLRVFELDCFDIKGSAATEEELSDFQNQHFLALKCDRITNYLKLPFNQVMIIEKDFIFDPKVLNLKGEKYLNGYWQSEKYFADIASIIRKDFSFRDKPNQTNAKLLEQIAGEEAVSVHVRRGDYVQNSVTNNYHGICDLHYYHDAVNVLQKRFKNLTFYVFSDDSAWVKDNLKIKAAKVHYVDHNAPDKGFEDMRLMTNCKHFIIANSSFSWWGAWLSDYEKKNIIAPKKWFNDASINTSDLIPSSWERI